MEKGRFSFDITLAAITIPQVTRSGPHLHHGGAPNPPLFSSAASRAARRAAGSLAEGLSPPPRASVRQLLWEEDTEILHT